MPLPPFMTLERAQKQWAFDKESCGWQDKVLGLVADASLKTLTMALSPGGLPINLLQTCLGYQLTPGAIKDAGLDYFKDAMTEQGIGTVMGYGLLKNPKPDRKEKLSEGDGLLVELGTHVAVFAVSFLLGAASPANAIPMLFGVVMYFYRKEKEERRKAETELMQKMVDNWNRVLVKNLEREAARLQWEKDVEDAKWLWDDKNEDSGAPSLIIWDKSEVKHIFSKGVIRGTRKVCEQLKIAIPGEKYSDLQYAQFFRKNSTALRQLIDGKVFKDTEEGKKALKKLQGSLQSVVKPEDGGDDVRRFTNFTPEFVPLAVQTSNAGAGLQSPEEVAVYDIEQNQDGGVALVPRDVTTASKGLFGNHAHGPRLKLVRLSMYQK